MNSKGSNRLHVFFTSTMRTSFIQDDIDMLSRRVALYVFIGSGVMAAIRIFFKATASEINLSWFASVYSFFMVVGAKLGRKKTIIILGGLDTAKEKALNYGIWLSWWKSILLRYALRNADNVLAVDMSL